MCDAADGVQQDLRRKDRRGAGMVVIRRHLDQVDPDDPALPGQAVDQLQHLIVKKAPMRRRAGARRDRGVETVDIQRQILVHSDGNTGQHGLHPQFAHLTDRQDVRPHGARGLVPVFRGRTDIADAKL